MATAIFLCIRRPSVPGEICNNTKAATSLIAEKAGPSHPSGGRLLPFRVPTPTAPGRQSDDQTGTAWKTLPLLAVLALLFCGQRTAFDCVGPISTPGRRSNGVSQRTAPPTGGSVEVTCTVVDSAGAPVTQNEPCTFTVVSQPGTDASLGTTSVTVVTDEDGVATATLNTGSTPASSWWR